MTGKQPRISQEFLPCRDYGHTWLPYDAYIERGPRRIRKIRRIMLCGKCGTKRTQTLDARYEIVGNSYRYPTGYIIKGRLTAEDRAAIRQETTTFFPHAEN